MTNYSVLNIANEEQKKIYFINRNVSAADQVIESVDVLTKNIATESKLATTLAAHSAPAAEIRNVEYKGKYLVVYYRDTNKGKYAYTILDSESGKYLDTFVDYCSATTPEERDEYALKYHKYLIPLNKGLNFVETRFGCA